MSYRAMLRILAILVRGSDETFTKANSGEKLFFSANTTKAKNLKNLGEEYKSFTETASQFVKAKDVRAYITKNATSVKDTIDELIDGDATAKKSFESFFNSIKENKGIDIGKLSIVVNNQSIKRMLNDIVNKSLFCQEDREIAPEIKLASDRFERDEDFNDESNLKEEAMAIEEERLNRQKNSN